MTQAAITLTDSQAIAPSPNWNGYPKFNQAYNSPTKVWQKEVVTALSKFVELPIGWDGYNGRPLKWDASSFALHILESTMTARTPVPQVVPTAVGGVQLEWHEKDIDLEIHILGPYKCEFWFRDHRNQGAGDISSEITNDFSVLKMPLELLNTR